MNSVKSKKKITTKKLQVDSFEVFVTEFNTKILEAFVKERKVSFLLIVKYPVRNVCTNYKLKTVQNKFVKEISFQKISL